MYRFGDYSVYVTYFLNSKFFQQIIIKHLHSMRWKMIIFGFCLSIYEPRHFQCDQKKTSLLKELNSIILKILMLSFQRNKLVVITGLSGSGKSSLAFDTLYAEGQRRYVESLSSYARQFLGKLHKPKVDYIKGIAPAIAIEQKVNSTNPRSTVGTSTEIYDYIKLLYARIGRTFSPISGGEVKKHTVTDVIDFIKTFEDRSRLLLLSPIEINEDRDIKTVLKIFHNKAMPIAVQ